MKAIFKFKGSKREQHDSQIIDGHKFEAMRKMYFEEGNYLKTRYHLWKNGHYLGEYPTLSDLKNRVFLELVQ